jgi:hypothetical protein
MSSVADDQLAGFLAAAHEIEADALRERGEDGIGAGIVVLGSDRGE